MSLCKCAFQNKEEISNFGCHSTKSLWRQEARMIYTERLTNNNTEGNLLWLESIVCKEMRNLLWKDSKFQVKDCSLLTFFKDSLSWWVIWILSFPNFWHSCVLPQNKLYLFHSDTVCTFLIFALPSETLLGNFTPLNGNKTLKELLLYT